MSRANSYKVPLFVTSIFGLSAAGFLALLKNRFSCMFPTDVFYRYFTIFSQENTHKKSEQNILILAEFFFFNAVLIINTFFNTIFEDNV